MATLLHIDSSLNGDTSVSREVARTYRDTWKAQHPDGTVLHRDLAADPLPHLSAPAYYASFTAPEERTPEQRAAFALREQLAQELERADAVLLGAPLYNYGIPSTLKAWLDHVMIMGRTTGAEERTAAGTPVTVVASRGGSYAPGTPQEGNDFAQNYLRHTLGTCLGLEVGFIVPELTLARTVPAMADLIDLSDASRARAHQEAENSAQELARRLAA
ncbi:NAD(P)H-dependent oxidoreductase [Streptomyces sp. ACA25]|uniref:FMN-dependent NADH-azoreductase n=1 Tax=Streptomyces sp. ACA25 TaxID=3022596 RepID=UPI002307F5E5|nr:NAD(P)H-dependent oxidoreductase [Streptomyces sp. ACA25]MDB1086306.1 NAD(P)H-dependent oxidoreductase [Streptomyces sp. ACA25]